TMLPAVMKAEYQKFIRITDVAQAQAAGIATNLLEAEAGEVPEIDWQQAETTGLLPTLLRLRQAGGAEIRYQVNKKNKIKMMRLVASLITTPEQAEEIKSQLRAGSKRKEQLVDLLLAAGDAALPVKH